MTAPAALPAVLPTPTMIVSPPARPFDRRRVELDAMSAMSGINRVLLWLRLDLEHATRDELVRAVAMALAHAESAKLDVRDIHRVLVDHESEER